MGKRKLSSLGSRVTAGCYVLCGPTDRFHGVDWYLAKVLLVAGDEIVTEHNPPSGGYVCRQIESTDRVIAIGSISHLSAFKERARKLMEGESKKIRDAESALGRARSEAAQLLAELIAEGQLDRIEQHPDHFELSA